MATCFPEHRQLLIRRGARGASVRVNIPLGRVLDPGGIRSIRQVMFLFRSRVRCLPCNRSSYAACSQNPVRSRFHFGECSH